MSTLNKIKEGSGNYFVINNISIMFIRSTNAIFFFNIQFIGTITLDNSLAYKIVDELETWKERQKEMFKEEVNLCII